MIQRLAELKQEEHHHAQAISYIKYLESENFSLRQQIQLYWRNIQRLSHMQNSDDVYLSLGVPSQLIDTNFTGVSSNTSPVILSEQSSQADIAEEDIMLMLSLNQSLSPAYIFPDAFDDETEDEMDSIHSASLKQE